MQMGLKFYCREKTYRLVLNIKTYINCVLFLRNIIEIYLVYQTTMQNVHISLKKIKMNNIFFKTI